MSKLEVKDWLQVIYWEILIYGVVIISYLTFILIEVCK